MQSSQLAEKPRLRRAEVVDYLAKAHGVPITRKTLETLATRGGGPRYQKLGRTPLYPVDELDRWVVSRLGELVSSSTEAQAQNKG